MLLWHAYEHVLIAAVIEGVRPVRRPCYQGYVDALNVLGARAASIDPHFRAKRTAGLPGRDFP